MKSINIKFPIEDDKEKNGLFKVNYVTKTALVSDLTLLFKTKKGQRYYMPDYGTNLEKFLFQPEDNITEGEIIEDLRKSVRTYMPGISITGVQYITNEVAGYEYLENNELNLIINFTYTDDMFSDNGQIELSF